MRAEDILPDHLSHAHLDGVTVRKGSVGAFLANARVLADAAAPDAAREEAGRHLAELLPALRALGLFDVLAVRDPAVQAFIDGCQKNPIALSS